MSRNDESNPESEPVDDAPSQEHDGREERTLASRLSRRAC